MSDKRTPNIVATAPERIYLVIGEDVDKSTDFADLCGEGITWCEDKIDGNSIEYVRADKNAEPIGYIYSNNGVKVGAINRYDVPNGTPLYTHPPESRVAELEAALRIASDALVPLQNAHLPIEREMLTDEDVKNAADAISTIIAALAGNPAPRLTDAETEKLRAEAAAYKWAYEYLQSRMNSIDRNGWAHDCDGEIEHRIEAKVRGTT